MVGTPLVTIVTPAFNQARFIERTVESVLAQDYPHIEYLVVDDGSTDDTAQRLEPYRDRLSFTRQTNQGQAATLNGAWARARGRYIGYLSSDDLLSPGCVATLVRSLENDERVVCAFPAFDLIDADDRVLKRGLGRPFSLPELVVEQESHIGPGALFRREAFARIGGWRSDLKLGPDREFWIRLAGQGSFAFVQEAKAGYRLHGESITVREVSDAASQEFIRVLDSYYGSQTVDPECGRRKDEAYGRASLTLARNALRGGRLRSGYRYYREAGRRHPPLAGLSTQISLFRAAVSKPARLALHRLRSNRLAQRWRNPSG